MKKLFALILTICLACTSMVAMAADSTDANFKDISGHWAEDDINNVVAAGILNGIDNTTFSPNTNMTRGMFVTAIKNMENDEDLFTVKDSSFTDLKDGDYYTSPAVWAQMNKIVSGISATSFDPNANITREQICVMLKNYADFRGIDLTSYSDDNTNFTDQTQISSWAKDAVMALYDNDVINGRDTGNFDPSAKATRAEVARMLNNFYTKFIVKPATTTKK